MAASGKKEKPKPVAGKKIRPGHIFWGLVVLGGLGYYFYPMLSEIGMSDEQRFKIHQQDAVDGMTQAIADCQYKFIYGELKTYVQAALCANPGIIQSFQDAEFPYMDLIRDLTDERVELAKKLDKKEITLREAQVEDSKFLADLQEKALVRRKEQTK